MTGSGGGLLAIKSSTTELTIVLFIIVVVSSLLWAELRVSFTATVLSHQSSPLIISAKYSAGGGGDDLRIGKNSNDNNAAGAAAAGPGDDDSPVKRAATAAAPTATAAVDAVTVFYHIYIPLNDTRGRHNALRIVREQIGLIRGSYAASLTMTMQRNHNSRSPDHGTTTTRGSSGGSGSMLRIIYNTVGGRLDPTEMETICKATSYDDEFLNETAARPPSASALAPVRCELGRHYQAAFEERTLQQLYEHCGEVDNENEIHTIKKYSEPGEDGDNNNDAMTAEPVVIYMHSKGSYHQHWGINEKWRPHLTRAVTSQQCLDSVLLQQQQRQHSTINNNNTAREEACNVCGLQFWPVWNTFFPGNFFAARCSYVRKLVPPVRFASVLTSVTKRALTMERRGLFVMKLFDPTVEGVLMVDRYSAEAWVGSHPALVPCDVSQVVHHDHWPYIDDHHNDERQRFRWSLAPRRSYDEGLWFQLRPRQQERLRRRRNERLREFFLLPGKLYQWKSLYYRGGEEESSTTTPPEGSWAWDWYPDGREWRRAVAEHGGDAVLVVTQRARRDAMLLQQQLHGNGTATTNNGSSHAT